MNYSLKARLPFAWLLALRFLREGRLQSVLILSGVIGGVAVIIFLTQLINQLQAAIIDRVLGSQAHIVIRPPEEETNRLLSEGNIGAVIEKRAQRLRSIDQWESIMQLAENTHGIVAVSPVVSGAGFATRGSANQSIALMGIDPNRYKQIIKMDTYIVAGRFAPSANNAVIGSELAHDLGIGLGDRLRIVTAEARDDIVTVTGIFDIGNKDLNKRWVFVSLKLGQSLLNLPGGVSNIDLTVNDLFQADGIARILENQTGMKVESWMKTNSQLLAALRNQTISNNLIRTFIILIVALGIASVLAVSVVQKQKEIGILRAMGASRYGVMKIFLLQGGLVGFIGSILGSLLGYSLLQIFSRVYRNSDGTPIFAPELNSNLVIIAWLVAIIIGIIAAAIPARRAALMDPVQAIRA